MTRKLLLAALAAAALATTACGLDCETYCDKMKECSNDRCDTTQCVNFCEMALDNDEIGFEGSAECALEASCADLDNGACFPYGEQGRRWCED